MDKSISIAVVGAGAIGGITAAFLAKAGWPVELVCKHPEFSGLASSRGLKISGVKGDHTVPVPSTAQAEGLSGPKDIVFLATKATDMIQAARDCLPYLKPDGVLVSQQNGICEEALAQVVGRERVMGCVVGFGATMLGPAELEMTSTGELVIGELNGAATDRLNLLKGMMDNIAPTRITPNIMGELYSKLIVNSCINSLGLLTGLYLGEMLAARRAREIFIAIMREAVDVANALGIKVEPGGGGKLDYYDFLAPGFLAGFKRHLMIRLIGFKYRRLKSSSLQSVQRGRKSEISFLNGYISQKAVEAGIAAPVNDAVIAMVEEIEAGKREISPENLKEIVI